MAQVTHWSRVGTGTKALSHTLLEPRDPLLHSETAGPPACSAPLRTAVCKTEGPLCPLPCDPAPNENQPRSSNKRVREEMAAEPLGFRIPCSDHRGRKGEGSFLKEAHKCRPEGPKALVFCVFVVLD